MHRTLRQSRSSATASDYVILPRVRPVGAALGAAAALLSGCVWVDSDPPKQNTLIVDNRTEARLRILIVGDPDVQVGVVPAGSKGQAWGGCLAAILEARAPDGTVVATLPPRRPNGCDPEDVWVIKGPDS